MPEEIRLSKSQFLRGLQCPKALWLYRKRKDLIAQPSEAEKAVFEQGRAVGLLAQRRFPGGTLIAEGPLEGTKALASTEKAAAGGAKVLYEAAAAFDGILIRADILVRAPGGESWDFIEVKSTSEVKDVHIDDAAVQRYVLEGAGYLLRKVLLMHVDTSYVRAGELDPGAFFSLADLSAETKKALPAIPAQLSALRAALERPRPPQAEIGGRCTDPYDCPFIAHCWADVPEYSVFDLAGMRMEKRAALWREGIRTVAEVPEDAQLNAAQALQVQVARSGRPHIDPAALAQALAGLSYPLYFLDFEAINPAIPPFDGLRPFQQLPFQASVHALERQGGRLTHAEFLGDGRSDPRPGLSAFLLGAIGPRGSVIAYNKSFEGTCLKELAEADPRSAPGLLSIRDRLWDLAGPFRKALFVHPGFEGSWSIKKVLPALVPEMSYAGLAIGEGTAAQTAYLRLMGADLPATEAAGIARDLKAYCGQDTLAMVRLLETLRRAAG